jgi:filamentous hemagglutinin family protein
MSKIHFWLRSTIVANSLLAGALHAQPEGFCLIEGEASLPFMSWDGCYVVKVGKHAIIRWNSFSVEKGETFRFEQEDSESSVINYVVGESQCVISGNVQSNGKIYLDHPSKLLVFPDGSLSAPQIVLVSEQGSVEVHGTLTANDPSGKGGKIHVLGNEVDIEGSAVIDATGAAGVGEVLIGGSFQGKDRSIPHSRKTIVQAGAQISLDSLECGNGGRAIIWSDESTQFAGHVSARGGREGGDGGFVEVSGKEELAFNGTVTTEASIGKTGQLLLDPQNVNLYDDQGVVCPPGGVLFTDSPADTVNMLIPSVFTALSSSNVTIQANNNIGWFSGASYSFPSANQLFLRAGKGIAMLGSFVINVGAGSFVALVNDPGAIAAYRLLRPGICLLKVDDTAMITVTTGTISVGSAFPEANPSQGGYFNLDAFKKIFTGPPGHVTFNLQRPKNLSGPALFGSPAEMPQTPKP